MSKFTYSISLLVALLLSACNSKTDPEGDSSSPGINMDMVLTHVETLASDEFLGRKPFTEGETKTVNYLTSEFEKLGLKGANNGSYTQNVPLVEITGTCSEFMQIRGEGVEIDLKHFNDYVAVCPSPIDFVALNNSELVFAGYGIVAPEYDWNDYEGMDWTGKTAVVLVNDPGFRSGDSTLFKGDEMTYYGRWTYKYEEAARQGCAGLIIVHQTEPASYGWNVVQSGWNGSQLSLESNLPTVDVEAWMSLESTEKILEGTELAGSDLRQIARERTFEAVPLGLTASVDIHNEIRRDESQNVLAMIPGNERKDEVVIYTAHWDHFGVGNPIDGDSIYNGAIDNATGTAALLGIADAMLKYGPLKRTVVLLAVTAEEQGLLGSKYYSEHPVFAPSKTVAAINMDAISAPAPMKDITIRGYGQSELDEYADAVARLHGRYILPDPDPEKGFFFRSDHFNFAKIGIPAIHSKGDFEAFGMTAEKIKEKKDNYVQNIYHQPSDEYAIDSSMRKGIEADILYYLELGLKLADSNEIPEWYEGSEFKATREEYMP